MAVARRAAHELGLAIQIHCIPCHAAEIGKLAGRFPRMPVIIDHLGRPSQGTPQEHEQVLRLAELANVHIKFTATGVAARSQEGAPPWIQKC
jgi:predicted TIM-barrel fold metal-dependent hydrolase